jgi:hypothetical protein
MRRPWWMLLLLVTLMAAHASAQSSPASASGEGKGAQETFREAQKLYEARDWEGALPLFREAFADSGSPNAHLYVARCLRELGKLDEAYEEMKATVAKATELAEEEAKYAPTRDAAATELALLERKVARIVVAIADPPSGTSVELNGKPLPADKLGVPIAVMPGEIEVRASAPGSAGSSATVDVGAGQMKTIALALAGADDSEAPPPVVVEEPQRRDSAPPTGGGLRTAGFVAAGVGVVGLAVFAIAGSMANSRFATLEDECGDSRCQDPKYADTVDEGKRFDTMANIGLVVGALGLAAGGAMIVFGGPSKPSEGASVAVSPSALSFGYRGRF